MKHRKSEAKRKINELNVLCEKSDQALILEQKAFEDAFSQYVKNSENSFDSLRFSRKKKIEKDLTFPVCRSSEVG